MIIYYCDECMERMTTQVFYANYATSHVECERCLNERRAKREVHPLDAWKEGLS